MTAWFSLHISVSGIPKSPFLHFPIPPVEIARSRVLAKITILNLVPTFLEKRESRPWNNPNHVSRKPSSRTLTIVFAKCQKHAKNHSTIILELFCAKIFKKWDNHENEPSCKGYNPCKGYSLCKMVSLGQKLKMQKTCEKPFYNNIRVVLCKKPLYKTPNIQEMREEWKRL